MVRTILVWTAVGVMAVMAGCRVCAHPYDYCGPTFTNHCDGNACLPNARAGSILSPPLGAGPVDGTIPDDDLPPDMPVEQTTEPDAGPSTDPELQPVPDAGMQSKAKLRGRSGKHSGADLAERISASETSQERFARTPGVEEPIETADNPSGDGWTARASGTVQR